MLAINILGILDFNLASGFQKFLNPNNNNATFTHAAILVAIAIPICPKESKRIIGESFCGLPLDEYSESDMTDDRISQWANQLKNEISGL